MPPYLHAAAEPVAADRGQRQSQVTVIGRRFGAALLSVGAVVGRGCVLEAAAASSRSCVVGSLMWGSLRWVFVITNTFEIGSHALTVTSVTRRRSTAPRPFVTSPASPAMQKLGIHSRLELIKSFRARRRS